MLEHARRFLDRVLPAPREGAYLNVHWSYKGTDGNKYWDGRACTTVDEAIRTLNWQNTTGASDLYVCMSTQARLENKVSKKGKAYKKAIRFSEDVVAIRSLFIDVDVKEGAYADTRAALEALKGFITHVGLPSPSAVVLSGSGGFHVHWVLDQDLARSEWQALADALARATLNYGLKCDSQCTVDSARILRVPETFNRKGDEPKPVKLLSLSQAEISVDAMQEALAPFRAAPAATPVDAALPVRVTHAGKNLNSDLGAGLTHGPIEIRIEEVAKSCGFISHAIASGGRDNSQPLWFMTAAVSTFVEDGRAALHMMSDKHAGYRAQETDELYNRVVATQKKKDTGWPTCSKIALAGAKECPGCPLFKLGKSPLNHVIKAANDRPDPTLPERYVRNAEGIISYVTVDENGQPMTYPVAHYPILSGWLSNAPWTLHFTTRTDNRRWTVEIPCEVITSKDGLNKHLGSRGFFLSDKQYRNLKEFFVSWLQKLQNSKDSVISAAPFGWSVVDGKTEGFAYGGRVWMDNDDRPAANPNPVLQHQYTPKGDVSVWREVAKIIYEQDRPALNAILAVAFAGPLVRFTGHPGLILNAYSPESGIGKTTAMKCSQAVWGHPVLGMQALNDTANSVLGKMGQLRSLPMYWDEIKSESQIKMFCSMVFNMTGGREKTRMTQDAQLRQSGQWQTIMVSASNESLVDGMGREAGSTTAGLYRLFEYVVTPPAAMTNDLGMVQRLVGKLEDNYGHAGLMYSKFLGVNWRRVEREVAELQDEINREVRVKQDERMWTSTMAVVLKGAMYANELGLTEINIDTLRGFLLDVLEKNRGEVTSSPSDLTTDHSAVAVLGELLNSTRNKYTLITNKISIAQGKPKKGDIQILNDATRIAELRIQIGREDKLIRIASTFLTRWMGEHNFSRVTWIKKMETEFGMRKTVGILGGGTDIVGAKEQLYELDMNHPKLSQFIE